MEIFPAIDIKGGQVVRLTQGDYDRVDVYAADPEVVAQQFLAQGATNLHVVDLDGAREGTTVNEAAIRKLASVKGLFIEVGGGIRDQARIDHYLSLGVGRVILGTIAVQDFDFTARMIAAYGAKIAVGVDAKEECVAVQGWLEVTKVDSIAFCKQLEQVGLKTVIYTDIAKDGAMSGTNMAVYRRLADEVTLDVIASGGICSMAEIQELGNIGTHGAILGKALYTGALRLEEVLATC